MKTFGETIARGVLAMAGRKSPWGGGEKGGSGEPSADGTADTDGGDPGEPARDPKPGSDPAPGPRNPWLPSGDGPPRRSAGFEDLFRPKDGPRKPGGGGFGGGFPRMPQRPDGKSWTLPIVGGLVLVWLFAGGPFGWIGLLADGDVGWHIRTGDHILNTFHIPARDLFSFSRPNDVWFAWEWLADVIFALLHRAMGLKGVVLLAGVAIPLSMTILLFHMLRRGANIFVGLAVVMLGVGGSSVHFLARPHVLTLLLLVISLFILDRDRLKNSNLVWILIPLTALWTNLHGGFVSIVACTGLVAAGSLLSGRWAHAKRYGFLAAGMLLASLINPYGYHLHLHVFQYLRAGWIRDMVEEFQSPSFRSESMLQFEILLFAGLIVTASYVRRRRWPEALMILFWAHMSLGSLRHIPIYSIAAGPWIASEITDWWNQIAAGKPKGSVWTILDTVASDLRRNCLRFSPWIAVPVIILILINEPVKWPQDFPKEKFPVAIAARNRNLLSESRVFTSDQWADYLIYHNYPRQKVFLDGRSDFYGPKMADEYLHLIGGRPGWDKIFEFYKFDVALVPAGWALASLLERERDWETIEKSGEAVLYRKRQVTAIAGQARAQKSSTLGQMGLMKIALAAER